MENRMKNILLILLSVSLNAAAQILMRWGMLRVGEVSLGASLVTALPRMIGNIFLWLAMASYGVSIITWMIVLSRVEVSFAYAFLSLGFVLVTVIGYFFFYEHVTPIRVMGIALICAGVFFVSRS
jgi:multidrug transporter EmrE-like cation transporter